MSGTPLALDRAPQLLDAAALQRTLTRLAHEVIERHQRPGDVLLAGIRTRGVPIAERLAQLIAERTGERPGVCAVSTAAFRDDRPHAVATDAIAVADGRESVDVTGASVVLVDDVMFTGRTVRAGIDALLSAGRPAAIEVLELIDRGHRELPVRATYVGKNVPTGEHERVQVRMREIDGVDGAWLLREQPS